MSSPKNRLQYKTLTIARKLAALREVEKGVKKKTQIAKDFCIPLNTLSTYIKNKERILSYASKENETRRRATEARNPEVDECVLKWIKAARGKNIPLTGTTVRAKAEKFAYNLGKTNFKASCGWLDRFKKRNGISSFKNLNEEADNLWETADSDAELLHPFVRNSVRNVSSMSSKGVTLSKITNFLEKFAPVSLAEKWDNTGLLLEPTAPKNVDKILLTNDLTEEVVSEALNLKAGMIISYHPPIFSPLMKITTKTWKERVIATCLENKIAVYSPHTCWDSVPGGVNDWLASAFDVSQISPIIPNDTAGVSKAGAGRYCKLSQKITISEAVENVKKIASLNILNLSLAKGATLDSIIKDVAICAGSGSSILNAKTIKADLYLTGEMSHHGLLDAIHNGSSVILCNHSNSERGFLRVFATLLAEEFDNVTVFVSEMDRDPIELI